MQFTIFQRTMAGEAFNNSGLKTNLAKADAIYDIPAGDGQTSV